MNSSQHKACVSKTHNPLCFVTGQDLTNEIQYLYPLFCQYSDICIIEFGKLEH